MHIVIDILVVVNWIKKFTVMTAKFLKNGADCMHLYVDIYVLTTSRFRLNIF